MCSNSGRNTGEEQQERSFVEVGMKRMGTSISSIEMKEIIPAMNAPMDIGYGLVTHWALCYAFHQCPSE